DCPAPETDLADIAALSPLLAFVVYRRRGETAGAKIGLNVKARRPRPADAMPRSGQRGRLGSLLLLIILPRVIDVAGASVRAALGLVIELALEVRQRLDLGADERCNNAQKQAVWRHHSQPRW